MFLLCLFPMTSYIIEMMLYKLFEFLVFFMHSVIFYLNGLSTSTLMTIQYSAEWIFHSLIAGYFSSFSTKTSSLLICFFFMIKSVYNQILYKHKSTLFQITVVNIFRTSSEYYFLIMSQERQRRRQGDREGALGFKILKLSYLQKS